MERMVFNVDEVAEILQTTAPAVRKQIKAGRLKAFKLGRVLIRKEDLSEFMSNSVGLDVYPDQPVVLEV